MSCRHTNQLFASHPGKWADLTLTRHPTQKICPVFLKSLGGLQLHTSHVCAYKYHEKKGDFMKNDSTNEINNHNSSHNHDEWVVFLNGKLFYLAQSHSIKDEESGKAFFESMIPAVPQTQQLTEIQIH